MTATAAVSRAVTCSVDRDELFAEARFVAAVAEKRATIPILNAILIEIEGAAVRLTATNLDVTLYSSVDIENTGTSAALCVDGKTLVQALSVLAVGPLSLTVDPFELYVTVEQGSTSFRLAAFDRNDYPSSIPLIPHSAGAVIPSDVLLALIRRTSFAVAHEETRFQLHGALLKVHDKQPEMIATDGHRLSIATAAHKTKGAPNEAMIPAGALSELARLGDGPIRYGQAAEHILFMAGGRRSVAWRALDVNFPNYRDVIPKNTTIRATVHRVALREALGRVRLMLPDQRFRGCKSEFAGNSLRLFALDVERGQASAVVPISLSIGDTISIAWNTDHVAQFLDSVPESETVTIQMIDKTRASIFTAEDIDVTYVVMPLRLG